MDEIRTYISDEELVAIVIQIANEVENPGESNELAMYRKELMSRLEERAADGAGCAGERNGNGILTKSP